MLPIGAAQRRGCGREAAKARAVARAALVRPRTRKGDHALGLDVCRVKQNAHLRGKAAGSLHRSRRPASGTGRHLAPDLDRCCRLHAVNAVGVIKCEYLRQRGSVRPAVSAVCGRPTADRRWPPVRASPAHRFQLLLQLLVANVHSLPSAGVRLSHRVRERKRRPTVYS